MAFQNWHGNVFIECAILVNEQMNNTNDYYQKNAIEYFQSTVNIDVSLLYERFVKYVPTGSQILDLGCGSGRDTKAFLNKGYVVDAIDGSAELCKLASDYTGIQVKCMDLRQLDAVGEYNAIWACASLLHISYKELPVVLSRIELALKTPGFVYMSFKHGDFEGIRDERYYTDMTPERMAAIIVKTNALCIIEEWYSEDVREDTIVKWYNVILRKS